MAGGNAKGVFQNELESGAGGFRDVQKDNHWICAAIIGVWRCKVNLEFARSGSNRTNPRGKFFRMFEKVFRKRAVERNKFQPLFLIKKYAAFLK